jgi:putative FmdB family regulatory protein
VAPFLEDPMPTYDYACTQCDHAFEIFQAFTDDALTVCSECDGRLRKVFGSVGVVFKGSGFYRNDSRSTAGGASGGSAETGPGSGTAGSAGDGASSSTDGGNKDAAKSTDSAKSGSGAAKPAGSGSTNGSAPKDSATKGSAKSGAASTSAA